MGIEMTAIPKISIVTTVNGSEISATIEPRMMLIDFLRDHLGLTGVKRSCDVQVCGACTVLLDGAPMSSCCTLAYEINGKTVTTIEGLARANDLDVVQQAFVDAGAIQCGFCTPGMILTVSALLAENPRPARDEVVAFLDGNLCRCTGYRNILDAVERAALQIAAESERTT